jgi:citrate synthase
VTWPVDCRIGPGLEGAIACETRVGYVNGARGRLVYRGYDVFDLCTRSTYEEVCHLLLHGELPTARELAALKARLARYRHVTMTLRLLMGFPVEQMNAMGALRLGTNLMRQEFTALDREGEAAGGDPVDSDEDSVAVEEPPRGEDHARYELPAAARAPGSATAEASGVEACYHLVAGVSTLTAAICRIRQGRLPLEPDPELGHAANLLYMMTGRRPTPVEERVMDIALILHADHGMNASTFAALVVASTLSDIYFSVGAGIAALNGPLHGGANAQVIDMLEEIGGVDRVRPWLDAAMAARRKITGFGHRVYRTYDPRARILGPLCGALVEEHPESAGLYEVARALEREVAVTLGATRPIHPNVDFYSGLIYRTFGIPTAMYTPIFAVSRVAGWTARVLEYLEHNRIFRPRAAYVGELGRIYRPLEER